MCRSKRISIREENPRPRSFFGLGLPLRFLPVDRMTTIIAGKVGIELRRAWLEWTADRYPAELEAQHVLDAAPVLRAAGRAVLQGRVD